MIKAVLLDLDNTILHGSESLLVNEYLQRAEAFFERLWGVSGLSRVLLTATRAVVQPRDAQTTNSDLAAALLAAAAGRSLEEVRAAFDAFFAAEYPAMRRYTQPATDAIKVVEQILAQGLALVIATNPLYPSAAIRQRLVWAGLPGSFDTYALVTTSDNMHFAKPDPAYYAEIIARVGIEPDEAIMVGDSLSNDVAPAASIGLRTFHVSDDSRDCTADAAGSLGEFVRQIVSGAWQDTLAPQMSRHDSVEPQLWGNVGALFGMLTNVQPTYWDQHPDPDEWSILQIVCHLLESEDQVQRPRLQRILAEDNPFLANPAPPSGPHAPPCDSNGLNVARRFADRRRETLALLRSLPTEAWNRPARHSVFGLTSLLEMALFTAQHDRLHLNQLCQTLGRCK